MGAPTQHRPLGWEAIVQIKKRAWSGGRALKKIQKKRGNRQKFAKVKKGGEQQARCIVEGEKKKG